MKTIRLTCAQAVVRFLKNQYVVRDGMEHRLIPGIFGIFGHGNVAGIGQAIAEYGGEDFPFYQPKNEQAMVHTAVAFAKAKQRLSAFACTTSVGPGATNMITGAATATTNRLPVLLLPSDIFANRIPSPVLQQLENPSNPDMSVNDSFKAVSRFWDRINRPEQILASLPAAMRVLSSPSDTGAVTICLPEDVQAECYDYPESFFEKRVFEIKRQSPVNDDIDTCLNLLKAAKKPMIVAGGGVHYSGATESLAAFCEKAKIGVGFTQAGKGALVDENPFSLGAVGTTGTQAANALADEADLVISLGSRHSDFTTASKTQFKNEAVRFVNVNLNAFDAQKHGAFPIVCDIKSFLQELTQAISFETSQNYQNKINSLRETWAKSYYEITHPERNKDSLIHQSEVIRSVNECLDKNATIVHAAGGLPGDLHKLWKNKSPEDYHSEYAYSCMGYEIAGALGVKMAAPHREVYAFVGDGSYLMLNHELVTSIQEGIKINVLLLDNRGYQCIHNLQKSCGSESFGNEFRHRSEGTKKLSGESLKIDFVKNAESLGAKVFVASTESELRSAIEAAKSETVSCLIYVAIESSATTPSYSWWDVPVSEVSTNPKVVESRSEYERNIEKQRFYY